MTTKNKVPWGAPPPLKISADAHGLASSLRMFIAVSISVLSKEASAGDGLVFIRSIIHVHCGLALCYGHRRRRWWFHGEFLFTMPWYNSYCLFVAIARIDLSRRELIPHFLGSYDLLAYGQCFYLDRLTQLTRVTIKHDDVASINPSDVTI